MTPLVSNCSPSSSLPLVSPSAALHAPSTSEIMPLPDISAGVEVDSSQSLPLAPSATDVLPSELPIPAVSEVFMQ